MPFFAAFVIFILLWYEGHGEASFVPSGFMGACWNWLSFCPVGGWRLIFFKWICYYLKAPYPKDVEMCAWNFYTEECLFTSKVFFVCCCRRHHLSRTLDISHPLHLPVSVTVRATRALEKIAVVFFLALSWGGGALNSFLRPPLPLHARNVVLKSEIGMIRKSSLPQTPLGGL